MAHAPDPRGSIVVWAGVTLFLVGLLYALATCAAYGYEVGDKVEEALSLVCKSPEQVREAYDRQLTVAQARALNGCDIVHWRGDIIDKLGTVQGFGRVWDIFALPGGRFTALPTEDRAI